MTIFALADVFEPYYAVPGLEDYTLNRDFAVGDELILRSLFKFRITFLSWRRKGSISKPLY